MSDKVPDEYFANWVEVREGYEEYDIYVRIRSTGTGHHESWTQRAIECGIPGPLGIYSCFRCSEVLPHFYYVVPCGDNKHGCCINCFGRVVLAMRATSKCPKCNKYVHTGQDGDTNGFLIVAIEEASSHLK